MSGRSKIMDFEKQQRLNRISIQKDRSILAAMRLMDQEDCKLLLVTDDGAYRGILSIGDVQRAIIANRPLETPVDEVLRKNVRLAQDTDDFKAVQEMMVQFRTEFMPVIDASGKLVDVYFWDEVFAGRLPIKRQIDLPVVVMAGGKGTRLKPFSNILPKSLFPLGEKTIIEVILDKFHEAGCQRFLLSVNHKHEFIRTYFDQLNNIPYQLVYYQEDKPLGTAGSLHLMRHSISETFFVSNCDIVISTDYSEIVDYHGDHNNMITIVAALKRFEIPYGTLETGEGGQLLSLQEKPDLNCMINAGLYLLEPQLLAEIPKNTFFHITDLIESVRKRGGRVGVFPVSEKSWYDIGDWEEYRKTMSYFDSKGSTYNGDQNAIF